MNNSVRLAVLAVSLLASVGCDRATERSGLACSPPRSDWQPTSNLDGHAPEVHLSLDQSGRTLLEGEVVGSDKLSATLAEAGRMNPRPRVILETQMGAPCEKLEALRTLIETHANCASSHLCAEMPLTLWRRYSGPQE